MDELTKEHLLNLYNVTQELAEALKKLTETNADLLKALKKDIMEANNEHMGI